MGSPALGAVTVYTPLGAWPSLTFLVPALRLFGTLNPEILGVLGLVSFLGSSAMLLSLQYSRRVCSTAKQPNSGWPKRIPFLLVWAPLGLVTGCASCAPLYLVAVGLFAPSLVVGGLSGVPLVPWIGFAGLLYLLSLGLAVYLIRRTTARETLLPSEEGGGNPNG